MIPSAAPPGLDSLPIGVGVPRLSIAKGKANLFLDGNPVVYERAVQKISGSPKTGDAVIICDWKDSAIAWGVYNETSMFKVRVLQLDREVRADPGTAMDIPALIKRRVEAAVQLRRGMGLPNDRTTVYRLINSEGDRLSGLIVDVLGSYAVVMCSAAWVALHRAAVVEALRDAAGLGDIAWRSDGSMLKMEGLQAAAAEGAVADTAGGDGIVVIEEGIRYAVDPLGQKTGFYADQRDSRVFLRRAAAGARVLDLCCYTGGFAINAAVHGAVDAVGVDSSAAAIDFAKRNAALNGVDGRCSFVCSEIEAFMEAAHERGDTWDVIILDPPKLAPSKKVLDRAKSKYKALNTAAMQLLRPGGLLMTCSCSGAMSQSGEFLGTVAEAARRLRRPLTVLREAGAASDHVQCPQYREGRYLTNVLLRVSGPEG